MKYYPRVRVASNENIYAGKLEEKKNNEIEIGQLSISLFNINTSIYTSKNTYETKKRLEGSRSG
jgi:hypothetical protein